MLFKNFFQEPLLKTDPRLYFQKAVSNGEARKVQKALNKGVNVNMQDKNGETSLMYALRTGRIKLFQTLLRHFPNVRLQNKKGQNILFVAMEENFPEFILPIVQVNPCVLQDNFNGDTPITYAVKKNNIRSVQMLIHAHADVNKPDSNGITPLMQAALNKNQKIVKSLLNAGADICAQNSNGETVINLMHQTNNREMSDYLECQLLIKELPFGPDVYIQNGYTPLTWAIENNKINFTQTLIDMGAQIDFKDKKGQTPLNAALQTANPNLIRLIKKAQQREAKLVAQVQQKLEADEKDLWKGLKIISLTEKQKILKMATKITQNSFYPTLETYRTR